MFHKCFAALTIIFVYQGQSAAGKENLETMSNLSELLNQTSRFSYWKYQIDIWMPTNFSTFVLAIVTISLSFKLIYIENILSICGRSGNLGVVHGYGLLPWRLPIIDSIYGLLYARVAGVKIMEHFVAKFGNLFEIQCGPIYVTNISDPDVIQKVLSSSQPEHLNRPRIYRTVFYDGFKDGLVTSDYEPWSAQRKRLSRSFTYKSLQQYLKFMNTHAKKLIKNVISAGGSKTCVEGLILHKLIYRHTFRIISQILFDTDGFSEDENAEFSDNFCKYKDHMVDRVVNPLSLGHYLWFHPKKREYDRIKKFLEEFKIKNLQRCKEEMEKEENTVKREDLEASDFDVNIKPFRCIIKELLYSGASDKEICDQIGTIATAGHETSVVAMTMLLMNLATNPEVQAKCRDEVDVLFSNKIWHKGESLFDCDLSMEDTQNLKYLDTCILESGRLHTTVPVFLRRLDAPVKISDEVMLGAGTNLSILLWTLHRDPKHFPDPEKFDPDRFLYENVKKRHPYAYIPFSSGPRNCIGSKVAHLQIKIFMAWIIRHFEISSTDKVNNIKLHFGLTIVPERPFNIILKRRTTN